MDNKQLIISDDEIRERRMRKVFYCGLEVGRYLCTLTVVRVVVRVAVRVVVRVVVGGRLAGLGRIAWNDTCSGKGGVSGRYSVRLETRQFLHSFQVPWIFCAGALNNDCHCTCFECGTCARGMCQLLVDKSVSTGQRIPLISVQQHPFPLSPAAGKNIES